MSQFPVTLVPLPASSDGPNGTTVVGLAAHIESQILSGKIPAGSRLPAEREIATQYGVSRTITREVLRSLRERGLIYAHVGRGTFVRELDLQDRTQSLEAFAKAGHVTALELIAARKMLECETAATAAIAHDAADAVMLRQVLEAFEAADEVHVKAELDVRFHEAIAAASHNPVLRHMFTSVRGLIDGMVLRSLADRRVREVGAPQHQPILAAILDRDPDCARSMMATHMETAERLYGNDQSLPLAEVMSNRASVAPKVQELLAAAAETAPTGEATA